MLDSGTPLGFDQGKTEPRTGDGTWKRENAPHQNSDETSMHRNANTHIACQILDHSDASCMRSSTNP
jgi:hypothetical protein